MKFLFLDDSKQKVKGKNWEYVGYGGFCIDSEEIKNLESDFYTIRKKHDIPQHIELKWSPNKRHFLNKEFKGERETLFREIMVLLSKYNAKILCAVHDINECYDVKSNNWSIEQAYLWATNEQLKFLIEKFENPYLEENDDIGLIIADHYGNKKGEYSLIKQSRLYIHYGTELQTFNRICLTPLTASSKDSPFIQIADLVIGITVGSLANSIYAMKLFDNISLIFLKNSKKNKKNSFSTISNATLEYGLKLSPDNFKKKGIKIFKQADKKYIYTENRIKEREEIK